MITVAITAPAFAEESPKKVGKALVTYYWLIDETSSRYHGKRSAMLRDVRGKTIASTTPRFKRDLVMEGSGWLRDGRTVMFDRRKDGESRFRITKAKYGLTITGCPLDPYRSIAVDPKFVKPGSTIYIPQLKGAKLPDGTEFQGPAGLTQVLATKFRQDFVRTATEKLLTYALGRGVEYYDNPTIRAIMRDAARDNYRMSSLILAIVKSTPFQMRRASES